MGMIKGLPSLALVVLGCASLAMGMSPSTTEQPPPARVKGTKPERKGAQRRSTFRSHLSRKPIPAPDVRATSRVTKHIGPLGADLDDGKARVSVPAGALVAAITVEIERLGPESLPSLPPGLVNVTEGGGGYRFLPAGQRFGRSVKVALPLVRNRTARLWSTLGARAFFWDETRREWQALPAGRISDDGQRLESSTDHFTIMINAVVQAPEHAGPANFDENAIRSIGAADPASNVDLIEPPQASHTGEAQVTFPFRLPTARGAYNPQLALRYSSDRGNGPIGIGWDLAVSRITIDTSRGVPTFDGSERYLLDGSPLIRVVPSASSTCRRPDAASSIPLAEFAERTDNDQRVLLCQGNSASYWEVTARDGVRQDYGADSFHRLGPPNQDTKSTAAWLLQDAEDPSGNTTVYSYFFDPAPPPDPTDQVYLARIDYNGYRGSASSPGPPAYRAALDWECGTRGDNVLSGRLGFLTTTRCRLGAVAITARRATSASSPTVAACYAFAAAAEPDYWSNHEPVRCYELSYGESSFDSRTLLETILVRGADGGEFYEHTFEYSEPEYASTGAGDFAFGAPQSHPLTPPGGLSPADPSWPIDLTNEENHQVTQSGGVSFKWGFGEGANAGCTIGGTTGASFEFPAPMLRLLDVDGDAAADRVWLHPSGDVRVALAQPSDFDASLPPVKNLDDIELQGAFGVSQSADGRCGIGPANASASTAFSLRLSATSATLVDVDGDGRVDLLSADQYHRGLPRSCRDGSAPTATAGAVTGTCSDGLLACADPATLCFASSRALSSDKPSAGTPITDGGAIEVGSAAATRFAFMPRLGLASRSFGRAAFAGSIPPLLARASQPGPTEAEAGVATASRGDPLASRHLPRETVESDWGRYTAARRRMEKERGDGYLAASLERVRTVIRWDAPLKGTIRLDASVRRVFEGGKDGVTVSLLLVKDFFKPNGTKQLKKVQLGPSSTSWKSLGEKAIDVSFGDSLLFVFDTGKEMPVSERGRLLDEVRSRIEITYRVVCLIESECRAVSAAELGHKDATGQLAYVYRYPHDFRTSDLPKETYWQMLPPLGPPIRNPTGNRLVESSVDLKISKKVVTDTAVHVRVRCEAVASQQSPDAHLCPLGTILRDERLDGGQVTAQPISVRVPMPEPFTFLEGVTPPHPDCIPMGPGPLSVASFPNWWQLENARGDIHQLYASQADADGARTRAATYDSMCFFGRGTTIGAKPYVHGYFAQPANDAARATEAATAAPAPEEDCVGYAPGTLEVIQAASGEWVLLGDRVQLMAFESEDVALQARSVARHFSRACYIGRDNSRTGTAIHSRHRDFVTTYFAGRLGPVFDPTRVMVEIDGEDGYEVAPAAVTVTADLVISSLADTKAIAVGPGVAGGQQTAARIVRRDDAIQEFPFADRPRLSLPVLHRVHPARDLQAYRVPGPHEIIVRATLVNPRHPLHVGITGDSLEGRVWQATLSPDDVPSGQTAVSREFTVAVPQGGIYYVRGYTEASFDWKTSIRLQAWTKARSQVGDETSNVLLPIPVNLLTADFGTSFYPEWKMSGLIGEVAHSFEPYAGGHHGFFYGLFRADQELRCVGPYPCKKTPPRPIRVSTAQSTTATGGIAQEEVDPPEDTVRVASLNLVDPARFLSQGSGRVPKNEHPTIPGCVGDYAYCCLKYLPDGDCDGDSIPNARDHPPGKETDLSCVLVPENFNGNSDGDGCPDEQDTDSDGILDPSDACPFSPKDFAGIPGYANGCPNRLPTSSSGRSETPTADSGSDGGGGCFIGAGLGAWICDSGRNAPDDGGSNHPGTQNGTGGAGPTGEGGGGGGSGGGGSGGRDGGLGGDIDGFRRTWTFGIGQSQQVGLGTYGLGIGIGGSVNVGAQYTDRDVFDWNGDGVVDFVAPNVIELGARRDAVRLGLECYLWDPFNSNQCLIYPGVRETATASVGFDLSGSATGTKVLKTTPEGEVKAQGNLSVSFGLGAHFSHSSVVSQRMDINGDGLPDQLLGEPGPQVTVLLSTGGELLAKRSFAIAGSPPGLGSTPVRPVIEWVLDQVDRAEIGADDSFTRSYSVGGGGGLQIGVFGGAVAVSRNDSQTITQGIRQFADVNGDGLPDIVAKSADQTTLRVWFNLGDRFASERTFRVRSWANGISGAPYTSGLDNFFKSLVFGSLDPLAASGSSTVTWAGMAEATWFFVTGSTSYSYTSGASTSQLELRDVDGDGVPDRILRTGNEASGALQVSRGLFGGANLLKTIQRPFGGVISLTYERSRASEDAPGIRWNLRTITLAPAGEHPPATRFPAVVTTIDYGDPADPRKTFAYFDRYEQENFGYATVRTTQSVSDGSGRIVDREYANRDYWLKGTLIVERVKTQAGGLLKETLLSYDSVPWPGLAPFDRTACLGQLVLPQRHLAAAGDRTPCDVRAPRLLETDVRHYEGGAPYTRFRQQITQYDNYGNATKLVEEHGGASQSMLAAAIEYEHRTALLDRNILDRAKAISVYTNSETGPLVRLRKAQYDDLGRLTRHETWSQTSGASGTIAAVDITPDAFGFVTDVVDANGYRITYQPDAVTHSIPSTISDNFGLSASADYDFRFRGVTSATDINGNVIEREYDQFGRLKRVRAPNERPSDTITVAYESLTGTGYPIAATTTNQAADPLGGELMPTLTIKRFVDGLGREIQVQTEAEVGGQHGRTVSGRVDFDELGRRVVLGEPVFVANTQFDFEPLPSNSATCTTTGPPYCTRLTWDAMDRPLTVVSPGGITVTRSYSIAQHPRDATKLVRQIQITDAEGKVQRLSRDGADRLVGVVQLLQARELKTTYERSVVGELLSVRDARNTVRTFEYDLAGRRTAVVTPETGRLEMAYDAMGNLVQQIDEELCPGANAPLLSDATCSGKAIVRTYDKNRLLRIDYPTSPDATFVYGDSDPQARCTGPDDAGQPQALPNIRGRRCWMEDATGTLKRSFSTLGEVATEERTIPLFAGSTATSTYVTSYTHDSFGRLLRLQYPDGEIATYVYDGGGRPQSVSGVRGGSTRTYVQARTYDVYGKTLETIFGNGVSEANEYEPDTQRLRRRTVSHGNTLLSAFEVTAYDLASNIISSVSERNEGHGVVDLDRSYTYDDLHRVDTFTLTGRHAAAAPLLSLSGDYDYDDVGNITRQVLNGTGTAASVVRNWTYTYGLAARPDLPDAIGPHAIEYTPRGSLGKITTSGQQATFGWHDHGQLASATLVNQTMGSYQYGSDGIRAWREVGRPDGSGGTLHEVFHYPNPYYTGTIRRTRSAGCTTDACSAFAPIRAKHVRIAGMTVASIVGLLDEGLPPAETAITYAAESPQYLHGDHVRSTTTVTSDGGAASRVYEYLPFGELLVSASTPDPIDAASFVSFHGSERDAESEFFYFGSRHSAPAFGRWISPDRAVLLSPDIATGGVRNLNLYAFSANNPLSNTDRDGTIAETVWDVASVGMGIYSISRWDENTSFWEKSLDVIGVGLDAVAVAVPILPGGVSAIIKGGKAAGKLDDVADAGRALDKASDAAAAGKNVDELAEGAGKLADDLPRGPDFVVTPDGTAVPVSQSKMREGFDDAGLPSRKADKTAEPGVIHEVPTKYGPTDVRTMEGSAHHPRRAVTTRAGTNDPVKLSGERFKGNVPKSERRDLSHLPQKE